MSDRNQSWLITADFTRLISQANKAARAIKNLDQARSDANRNAHKEIVQDTNREISSLDKLNDALKENVQARREYNRQTTASTTRVKRSADANLRAADTQRQYTSAVEDHAASLSSSAAATNAATSASRGHTRALNNQTKAIRAASSATARKNRSYTDAVKHARKLSSEVSNMTGRLGYLNRTIQSTQNHSRSWGLIMKMLPLTAVTSAINSMAPAVAGLGGAFIGLLGTMGPVFGMFGTLPALLAGVGGAIGGIISGVAGIGGAFSKYRKYQEALTKAQSKSAAKQEKEEKAKQKSIRSSERALTNARKAEARAQKGISDAEQRAADVAVDNARRLRDAQRGLVDAQKRVRDSQRGVTQARLDAARAIQEYRDRLRGAALDEESAIQSLESARAAAARVALDPGATDLERRSADLAVRQAQHQLEEVRRSNVEMERAAEDAAAKGIENSDQVVAAREAEADASESLRDAQENLADTQKQNARSTRDAQDSILDARDSYADAQERVADLQSDLSDLRDELAEIRKGTGDATDQLNEYNAAMEKLPPSARDVVRELVALSEAWEKVSYRAQDAISPGLLKALRDLRNSLLPPLADFLERMAGGAGRFAGAFTGLLSSSFGLSALNDIFEDGYDIMEALGEATLNVTTWLLGMGKAARRSGLTRWLGDTLTRWTSGWAQATATPEGLQNTVEAFQDTMYYTDMWGRAIRDTWRFLRTFFRAFRPLGEWMLESISETTKRWEEWARSESGEEKIRVWQELAKINLSGIADTIRTITAQGAKMFDGIDFQRMWDALNGNPGENNGLINALGDLLGIVTEDMIVNVFSLGEAIAGVLQAFGEGGGMAGVTMFVDALGGIISVADWLLTNIPGLSRILGGFLAVFAAKKAIEAVASLTGVSGIAQAATAVKAKGFDSGKSGYAGAFTKEYLGFGAFNPDLTDPNQSAAFIAGQGTKAQAKAQAKADRKAYRDQRKAYRAQQRDFRRTTPSATTRMSAIQKPVKPARLGGAGGKLLRGVGAAGLVAAIAPSIIAGLDKLSGAALNLDQIGTALERISKSNYSDLRPLDEIFTLGNGEKLVWDVGVGTVNDLDSALQYAAYSNSNWWGIFERGFSNTVGSIFGVTIGVGKVDKAFKDLDKTLATSDFDSASKAFREVAERGDAAGLTAEELVKEFPEFASVARRALEDANRSTKDYKATNEEIVAVMSRDLPDSLAITEGGMIVAADSVEALAEEQDKAARSAEELAEAQEVQQQAIDDSIDGWRAGRDAVRELNDAQREGVSTFMDAESAQADYIETLQEANSILEENGQALNEGKTGFNQYTQEGRNNAQFFRDLSTSARDTTDAMLANGASVDEVNAKMASQREEFIKTLEGFGIVGDAASGLADKYGLIPNYVGTRVYLENGKITQEELDGLLTRLQGLDDEDTIHDIMMIAQTEGLDAAMEVISNLPREAKIKIGFDVIDLGGGQFGTKGSLGKEFYTMRAEGGPISGPGTSTSDSIPARLSDGEYVVKAKSVSSLGVGTLDYLNRTGQLPQGFATGGFIRASAPRFNTPAKSALPASTAQGVFSQLNTQMSGIQDAFNALGSFSGQWGSSLTNWWNSLWDGMLRAQTTANDSMVSAMSTTLSRIISSVTTSTASMGRAWAGLMEAQKSPIVEAIKFINDTLGTVVTTVARYYGVADTPFPVAVPGFADGGWTGPGSKYQPAGVVHADEFVVNKNSRQRIERTSPGLLDYMNRTGSIPGYATGGRVRPANGPEAGNYAGHSGIDYKVPVGTPVRAADQGLIDSTIRKRTSYGWHVVQRLAQGLKAVYAHLSGFNVVPGQRVGAGDVVGFSGNTGNSSGPHLHFEVGTSFGAVGNRNFTRAWLGGASAILSEDGPLGQMFDTLAPLREVGAKAIDFAQGLAGTNGGWGALIGEVVKSVAEMPLKRLEAMGASVLGDASASGNFGAGSQRDNAFGIIDVAMRRGMGHRGALLGVMAAMQESSLINIRGGDRDSLGLFQQRPSMGWGTPEQIMNPVYAANKFYDGLVKLAGWTTGPEWEDIQAVQISAFPRAYQKHKNRALQYLAEWAQARGQGFARGGWTGPGSKYTPAGIVHADEYVINKESRRKIERMSPGLLDSLNDGNIPGYADGGVVKKSATSSVGKKANFPVPSIWKDFKIFLSYLRKAESYDPKNPGKPLPELRNHVRFLEELMAFEGGLLARRDVTGRWGPKHVAGWKAWQKRNEMTQTGKVDADSVQALLKKHGVGVGNHFEGALPYVPGLAQPTRLQVLQSSLDSSNKQMAELTGYINKFKAMGMSDLADKIKELGPTGIPEELRDSLNPLNGLQLAREYNKNAAAARQYNDALKKAKQFSQQSDVTRAKMDEMLALLQHGEHSPYGLESLARELGVSMDTAVVIYRKLLNSGSLKNVPASRTSRLRGDVTDFDSLFKFNKGGIVPGVGDTDKVHALLTPGELVVPKDVVQSLFRPRSPLSTAANFNVGALNAASRVAEGSGETSKVIHVETHVHNPVAEPASDSIQKRVRSAAALGLFGRD